MCVTVASNPLPEVWEDILDALDAISPLIDDAGAGTAYLDMRGAAGDGASWIARVHSALHEFELPLLVGAAGNKFTARAAAYTTTGAICEAGNEAAFLAPLPINLLECKDPQTIDRLKLLGICTLGQLARLPHGPFVRRFGKSAGLWHAQASGIDPTPFVPRAHELKIEASLYGEGAVEQEEQVYFALRMLIGRVCEDLARLGKRAGMLLLTLECESGENRELSIGLAQPTSQALSMFEVMRVKVEGQSFISPITGLRLQAGQLEEGGKLESLFAAGDPDTQMIALTLARLETAFGIAGSRAKLVPAHSGDRAFRYDPFEMPTPLPSGVSALQAPVPQLRLLTVREIEVTMLKNAPAFIGTPPQVVLEFAGPWRIDEGWFETPLTRDEYDVLVEDGALYR
ncbi:MAG: hypothetical protein M3Y21_09540, partial [Candidatus Eremiobacteraeota bacterium]|nr:hypothetical protein [Candidatus Eremiobacteraeota bacterium]